MARGNPFHYQSEDEALQVNRKGQILQEKLRRLGKALHRRRFLWWRISSPEEVTGNGARVLVVPKANRHKTEPPFKPVFQVSASKEDSKIRIFNVPLQGSSMFLVKTGEGRTPPDPLVLTLFKQRKALAIDFVGWKELEIVYMLNPLHVTIYFFVTSANNLQDCDFTLY